jgi:translocation and assembly module TamB
MDSILRLTVVILLCVLGAIFLLGETSAGLQIVIQFVSPLVPGQLHIEQAEGALFSTFTLKKVSYKNATTEVSIDTLDVDWTPSALYNHQLKINTLTLAHVQSHIQSAANESNDKTDFDPSTLQFLQNVIADQVTMNDVVITHDKEPPIKIATLSLQKTTSEVTTFAVNALEGELSGTVILNWDPSFLWSLALKVKNINPGAQFAEWPGNLSFVLNTQGQLADKKNPLALKVSLQDLNGKLRNYPINGSIRFQFQHDQLQIQRAALKIADSYGDVTGSLAQNWNLNWNVNIPNLTAVLPKSKGSIASSGKLTGPRLTPRIQADIKANQVAIAEQKIRQFIAKMDLTLKLNTPAALSVTAYDLKIHDHAVKKIALDFTGLMNMNRDNWLTHLDIAIAKQRYIRIMLSLPKTINEKNYATQPLSAVINVNFPNLSTLKDSLPDIKNPQGTMQGTLQLQGSLTHPTINGEVKLANGSLSVPKLGINIRKANFRIAGNQMRHLNYTGGFQSGEGACLLQGTTDLSRADFPTEMTLRGNNLEIVNLPEYKINATPDLKLHLTKLNLKIDGKLTIPSATFAPKDFRQTITLPDDVVFVGAKQSTAAALLASMPTMQLIVKIDNKTFIHYQDLITTLGGSITVNTGPNRPATAAGELYANGGTYHAYGQDLDISEGRLIYTGGLVNNPGLNIKAVRKISTVMTGNTGNFTAIQTYSGMQILTVGVQILGTIDLPAITLFSQPSGLGQDDILSYLLLGIPRSQASIKDSLAILNATSALNLSGSAPSRIGALTKKLQTGLGLTELNVASVQTFDPTANQNAGGVVGTTSLVLGKKIANNLYLHYSVSLFSATPITILNLRYQFSKHWSVQSETSTIDNGADLLYSLERD